MIEISIDLIFEPFSMRKRESSKLPAVHDFRNAFSPDVVLILISDPLLMRNEQTSIELFEQAK